MTKPVSRSELSRLGKRGSYRLGTLAPQGVAAPAQPRPFRPSFGRPRRAGPAALWVISALAATALIAAGAMRGVWFVPLLTGVASGVSARFGAWRLRVTLPAVVLMCAIGWGIALAVPAARGMPVGATARAIAAIAGLPAYAAVGVAAALGVAVLQGLTGLWLGRALTPRSKG